MLVSMLCGNTVSNNKLKHFQRFCSVRTLFSSSHDAATARRNYFGIYRCDICDIVECVRKSEGWCVYKSRQWDICSFVRGAKDGDNVGIKLNHWTIEITVCRIRSAMLSNTIRRQGSSCPCSHNERVQVELTHIVWFVGLFFSVWRALVSGCLCERVYGERMETERLLLVWSLKQMSRSDWFHN